MSEIKREPLIQAWQATYQVGGPQPVPEARSLVWVYCRGAPGSFGARKGGQSRLETG